MSDSSVVYEDNHCLVIRKAFNQLSQGDRSGDPSVLEEYKSYLKIKYNKPGKVFLGLVHRLDRPAGGLMVLARTSKAAERLAKQFRQRRVTKVYRAVVSGEWSLPDSGVLHDFLIKDRERNTVSIVSATTPGALEARLSYKLLRRHTAGCELDVRLETGRPHQIRVQFAHQGHPLLGDLRYGATRALPGGNLALYSALLCFEAPVGSQQLCFRDLPDAHWLGLKELSALPLVQE